MSSTENRGKYIYLRENCYSFTLSSSSREWAGFMAAWEDRPSTHRLAFSFLHLQTGQRATSWIWKRAGNWHHYFLGPKGAIAEEVQVDCQVRKPGRLTMALLGEEGPPAGSTAGHNWNTVPRKLRLRQRCSHNQLKLFCTQKTKHRRKEASGDRVGAIILLFVKHGINKLQCLAFQALWIVVKLNWTKQTMYY